MTADLLLPVGSRLVHIGPQKTGTTSIQVALADVRDQLPALGAYYPEGPYRRRKAGWALGLPGKPTGVEIPIRHWDELVAEVRAAGDLRVCVSDENFARAEPEVAGRIVRDLGDERVHVVAVTRRLDRFLPSQWQERVKSGVTLSYEDWLERVLGDDPGRRERWNVWQGHDIGGLVDRWLEFVDRDRFTLVIADESERSQLPRVFEGMLGLPSGLLAPNPDRSNVGLSWSELEVLRALHDVYRDNGWEREDWRAMLPSVVEALRSRPERAFGPRTVPLPTWAHARVRELSDARTELVRALPVRVVGDPEHLRVPEDAAEQADPGEPLGLPVELVVAAIEGAVRAERRSASRRPVAEAAGSARSAGAESAEALSGRQLLGLAARRLGRRFRRA